MQIKYCIWGLLQASVILLLAGCSKSNETGGDDDQTGGNSSIQTSLKVQFVSRLTDASLIGSSSDAEAIEDFVNEIMEGNAAILLDRTDHSGITYIAEILVDSRNFSSFILLGRSGTDDFDVSTIVFNEPSDYIPSYQISYGSYVAGLSLNIDGTVTNLDSEGNVTGTNAVTITVPLFSCRLDTEEQVSAFVASSGVMSTLKSDNRNFVLVGTVRNSLMSSLSEGVTSADSEYATYEVYAGSDYTIFMIVSTRYWGYNGVTETGLTNNVMAYAVDISWN